jgi:NitT/TauT family transport system permease protein
MVRVSGYCAGVYILENPQFVGPSLTWTDVSILVANGALTLLRVAILIILATLVWVLVGVGVGLRPRLAEKVQPIAQFMAAFPANLLFPLAVFLIVRFHLEPKIWLSPLMTRCGPSVAKITRSEGRLG